MTAQRIATRVQGQPSGSWRGPGLNRTMMTSIEALQSAGCSSQQGVVQRILRLTFRRDLGNLAIVDEPRSGERTGRCAGPADAERHHWIGSRANDGRRPGLGGE